MRARSLIGVVALLATEACGSSPRPAFYALAPAGGAVREDPLGVIEVREPALAGYLDHREIVTGTDAVRIHYAGSDRWAEPVGHMICRVLAVDLGTRLPHADVIAESSAIALRTDEVVEVSIVRFERSDDRVSLVAQVVVESTAATAPRAPPSMRWISLDERIQSGGTPAMLSSMSQALGKLADAIAALLVERRGTRNAAQSG